MEVFSGDQRDYERYRPEWPWGAGPVLTWGDYAAIGVAVLFMICVVIAWSLPVLWILGFL